MGFPTQVWKDPASDAAMKQSLRLVRDVSLSMSWKIESLPEEEQQKWVTWNCIYVENMIGGQTFEIGLIFEKNSILLTNFIW